MLTFILLVTAFLAGAALSYGMHGSVRTELLIAKANLLGVRNRLNKTAGKTEAEVRAEIQSVVADLKRYF